MQIPEKVLEVMGSNEKELYQNPSDAYSMPSPLMLVLDGRSVRLPPKWLCRGLARDSFSHSELSYWQRHWGQQGLSLPSSNTPFRAPQAVHSPQRAEGVEQSSIVYACAGLNCGVAARMSGLTGTRCGDSRLRLRLRLHVCRDHLRTRPHCV